MLWTVGLGAAAVGALVGLAELVSRYREVKLIWRSPAAYAYLTLNASAALLAVHFFDGLIESPLKLAIASGVGAMALFRTSLFVVRVGDSDVAIGPGGFLQLLLAAADRGVDRLLGARRSRVVVAIMSGVSFAKAYQSLPVSCLNLVQGVPAAEQQALGQDIRDLLSNVSIPDSSKAYNLGLIMIQAVGEDVLREAVAALGASIVNDPPTLRPEHADERRAA
jgi:hypothetical protein